MGQDRLDGGAAAAMCVAAVASSLSARAVSYCLKGEDANMFSETNRTDPFCDYYKQWITVYKEGAIRKVTMGKYLLTHTWLVKLIPDLAVGDLDRMAYQGLLNAYAKDHERQTVMDFHHQLKGAILDAVDEGCWSAILRARPS